MRLSYRLEQLVRNLRSYPNPDFQTEAAELLSPGLMLLFRSMKAADQAHSLRVMRALQAQGHTDPDLLAAALLHDVGKAKYPLRVWERALIVLAQTLLPNLAQGWGQGPIAGWRRPFVIASQHPKWGAAMVAEVGGSETLVKLIETHQDEPEAAINGDFDKSLRALQAADNRN